MRYLISSPAFPALIVNFLILVLIAGVALLLNQPLAIIGLFWLQQIPADDRDYPDEVIGEESEYNESTIGFTTNLKE